MNAEADFFCIGLHREKSICIEKKRELWWLKSNHASKSQQKLGVFRMEVFVLQLVQNF